MSVEANLRDLCAPPAFPPDIPKQTFFDLAEELRRQRQLWGTQEHRNPVSYLAKLTEEFLEATREINDADDAAGPDIRQAALARAETELIQVAAVALSMSANLRRNRITQARKEPAA